MPVSDTPGYSIGNYRLPPFGEYDLGPNRALKVSEFVYAAGTDTAAYVAVAATDSDSYVDALVDTQETFAVWECGYDPVFVREVLSRVVTAFTAAVTTTVGDTDDVDAWLTEANIGSTIILTATVNSVLRDVSTDASTLMVYTLSQGKFYDGSSSDDSIDAVIGGADPTVGRMALYVAYFSADHAVYV